MTERHYQINSYRSKLSINNNIKNFKWINELKEKNKISLNKGSYIRRNYQRRLMEEKKVVSNNLTKNNKHDSFQYNKSASFRKLDSNFIQTVLKKRYNSNIRNAAVVSPRCFDPKVEFKLQSYEKLRNRSLKETKIHSMENSIKNITLLELPSESNFTSVMNLIKDIKSVINLKCKKNIPAEFLKAKFIKGRISKRINNFHINYDKSPKQLPLKESREIKKHNKYFKHKKISLRQSISKQLRSNMKPLITYKEIDINNLKKIFHVANDEGIKLIPNILKGFFNMDYELSLHNPYFIV